MRPETTGHTGPPKGGTAAAWMAAGLLGGAAVGIADGTWAALAARMDGTSVFASAILVAGLDALAGAEAGILGAIAALGGARIHAWTLGAGRRGRWAWWLTLSLLAGGVAAAAMAGTSLRKNRFLAAGIVALVTIAAAGWGAVVMRGRADRRPTAAGTLLAAPLLALAVEVPLFLLVWHARVPMSRNQLGARMAMVAAFGAMAPFLLYQGSRLRLPLRWRTAAGLAFVILGGGAAALVRARWITDFQFLPWRDIGSGLAIAFGGVLARLAMGPRERRAAREHSPVRMGARVAGPPLAVIAVLAAGASEPARKAAAQRAGLAGPLLALANRALDFDRDGYPYLLGGGDCDDRDPEINPAATDWPDDGMDGDCDGADASAAALRPSAPHPVPDTVPRDLNILLVVIDTLRADHLGCYGYRRPTSPVMDRLAADGTLFENAWAHAPSTRYSMPAIVTGRWPSAIEWDESIWWPRIARGQRTIAEALHDRGYFTAAFYAYEYFAPADARGFERGVDLYDARRASLHVNLGGPAESVGSSAREMADDGIAFLDAHKDRKFFLTLHFYDPHMNYEPHPDAPDFARASGSGAGAGGPTQIDLYDGEIWHTDRHLGRVLRRLDELGLRERTVVFVTGDHGEGLGERGIKAHGYHLYPPQTKVPLIVRVPGLAPRRVTAPVGHVDIAPTLVNLVRGGQEPSFLGRSLVDLMAAAPLGAATAPPAPVFQEVTFEGPTKIRALASATHQLVWNWVPLNTTECFELGGAAGRDGVVDFGSARDLWGSRAGEPACSELRAKLKSMLALLSLPAGYRDKLAGAVTAPGAAAPPPAHRIDARFGRAVRFLGVDLSAPASVAGGEVEVTYHFESIEPVQGGWRPFFHLEGPGGFRNLDHVPVNGAFPLERWRPGQRIRDRQRVSFPAETPPGEYTISVGVFRGRDRLPVTPPEASDGQDRLRVATITVR